MNSKNVVQSDLLITCDYEKARNQSDRYMGVPAQIIEIISARARARDRVKKLDVYLMGGVNEYCIMLAISSHHFILKTSK